VAGGWLQTLHDQMSWAESRFGASGKWPKLTSATALSLLGWWREQRGVRLWRGWRDVSLRIATDAASDGWAHQLNAARLFYVWTVLRDVAKDLDKLAAHVSPPSWSVEAGARRIPGMLAELRRYPTASSRLPPTPPIPTPPQKPPVPGVPVVPKPPLPPVRSGGSLKRGALALLLLLLFLGGRDD